MKYFKYKVTWYNSYEDEEQTDTGIVAAKTYGEAANTVVEDYGEEYVVDIYLYDICSEGVCLSKDELDLAFRDE